MKRCPICKIEKDLSEFDQYFSKKRNKYRIGNYCKECRKKVSLIRAKKYYEENSAACKEKAKNYRQKNDEKIKVDRPKFKKRQIENLQNCYVKSLLVEKRKIDKEFISENPEIIETARLQIKIKRKLKSIRNGKK